MCCIRMVLSADASNQNYFECSHASGDKENKLEMCKYHICSDTRNSDCNMSYLCMLGKKYYL